MTDYTYLEYVDGSNVSVCQTLADTFWSKTFFIGGTLIFFALPLAILIMLYSVIAINLMMHPAIIPLRRLENPSSAQRYRKKVVMMLGTVVTFFFVCLLPFRALIVWIVLAPHEEVMKLGNEGYYSLLYFCRIMFYLNSAINPILYNLMSSKFRNGFLKLCGIKRNCFRKHKKALLRTSTFNTSSLTAITTSSIHRPSIAEVSNASKEKKSSFLDSTSRKESGRRNSCSKSLLLCGELITDSKSVRLKGFPHTKGNNDKRKNLEKFYIRTNQINRKKTSRRKSFGDFLMYGRNTTTPVLNHSQSMDSIFRRKPFQGGKKGKLKIVVNNKKIVVNNNSDDGIKSIANNHHLPGTKKGDKVHKNFITCENDQNAKHMNNINKKTKDRFKESFV